MIKMQLQLIKLSSTLKLRMTKNRSNLTRSRKLNQSPPIQERPRNQLHSQLSQLRLPLLLQSRQLPKRLKSQWLSPNKLLKLQRWSLQPSRPLNKIPLSLRQQLKLLRWWLLRRLLPLSPLQLLSSQPNRRFPKLIRPISRLRCKLSLPKVPRRSLPLLLKKSLPQLLAPQRNQSQPPRKLTLSKRILILIRQRKL